MHASGIWMKSNLLRACLRARRKDIHDLYRADLWASAKGVADGYCFPFSRPSPATIIRWFNEGIHLSFGDRLAMGLADRVHGEKLDVIDRLDRAALLADDIFVSTEDIRIVGI